MGSRVGLTIGIDMNLTETVRIDTLDCYCERSHIGTTNLPFSEWPQVFTNARLCKAVLDRLTDQAHIIETGSESYRFRRTLRKKTKE
jgi:DNA replication protein DnaC